MENYLWVKLVHIISATILFGTGIGTAFCMLRAYLSNSREAMTVTTRTVVYADWIFTAPAVTLQLITGLWLTWRLGLPFGSMWFVSVIGLFILMMVCWIPVVIIQIRVRDIVNNEGITASYTRLMKIWIGLGFPALISVLILFFLMVHKTGVDVLFFK